MKGILIILILILVTLSSVSAEILTPGSVIPLGVESDSITSSDIKDVVKENLIRPYESNEFDIDVSQLPSVNDKKYLLTQITTKPIVITPDKFEINGKEIKFINGNAFLMPLTKYILAKNLRISGIDSNDILKVEDSKLSFMTHNITIKDGVVYVGEKELPIKVMPNMILDDLINIFKEENLKKTEVLVDDNKIQYTYTFNRPAKLLFWNTTIDVSIVVDGSKGTYSIKKPFYSIFLYGENAGIKEYNFTKYAAF